LDGVALDGLAALMVFYSTESKASVKYHS